MIVSLAETDCISCFHVSDYEEIRGGIAGEINIAAMSEMMHLRSENRSSLTGNESGGVQ